MVNLESTFNAPVNINNQNTKKSKIKDKIKNKNKTVELKPTWTTLDLDTKIKPGYYWAHLEKPNYFSMGSVLYALILFCTCKEINQHHRR